MLTETQSTKKKKKTTCFCRNQYFPLPICFPLAMTFEGVNNNILTPARAYKQKSVLSHASVPLYPEPRPEDTHPIENPWITFVWELQGHNNNNTAAESEMLSIFLPWKAKGEGRVSGNSKSQI